MTEVSNICPTWCTLPAADHELDPVDGSAVHCGPEIGRIEFSQGLAADGTPHEPLNAFVERHDFITPDELRALAVDALKAAEWLEANQ